MADTRTLPHESGSRMRCEAITLTLLAGIIAIGWALRVHFADVHASFDELWNLALSTGHGTPFGEFPTDELVANPRSQTSMVDALPAWRIWTSMDLVLHPPLYIVTLRFWRDLFGESEAAARALSCLWAGISIVFAYAAGREAMGRVAGLLVALIVAVAPTQIYFGQEMRSYQMAIAIGSVAIWLMTRIERAGPTTRSVTALACLPFFLVLTHYFAAGGALAIVIYGAWRSGSYWRRFAAITLVGAATYLLIWLPFALRQIAALGTGDSFLHDPNRTVASELLTTAMLPYRLLIDRPIQVDPQGILLALLYVLPLVIAGRLPVAKPWLLWLWASLVPLVLLDLARSTTHVELTRYAAIASPAIPLLIGACGFAIDRRLAWTLLATIAFACGINRASNVGIEVDAPSSQHIAESAARRAKPGDAILTFRGNGPAYSGEVFLLHCSHIPGFFPRPVSDLSRPMMPATVAKLPDRAWLIAVESELIPTELIPGSTVVANYPLDQGIMLTELSIRSKQPTTTQATASTRSAVP